MRNPSPFSDRTLARVITAGISRTALDPAEQSVCRNTDMIDLLRKSVAGR